MRVLSTEATTPNGNKYKITRLGRVISTSAFGAYGIYAANKAMSSDTFIKELTDASKSATKNSMSYYGGVRKAAFVLTAAAISALCGFIVGGGIDFVVNKISKNKADNKQKA